MRLIRLSVFDSILIVAKSDSSLAFPEHGPGKVCLRETEDCFLEFLDGEKLEWS